MTGRSPLGATQLIPGDFLVRLDVQASWRSQLGCSIWRALRALQTLWKVRRPSQQQHHHHL
jgi:hypothetical protein